MNIVFQILILLIGFLMLVKGADLFVDGASGIADRFKIPQLVIGLTIVAMGTSLPEASVSIVAALKGNADIAVGNVVGSNILNILLILGITALIVPVAVKKSTINVEIPFMILITTVLMVIGLSGNKLSFFDGIILILLFISYLTYLFIRSKKEIADDDTIIVTKSVLVLILYTVAGMVLIILGSDFAVDSATKLAKTFGVSERIIGLTIVAFGTSLPELVTSVTAARKGNADIAIGNIVGSNIFNILFILGITALITPVPYATHFSFDTICAIAAAVILWLCSVSKGQLKRIHGIILLLFEAGYLYFLIRG